MNLVGRAFRFIIDFEDDDEVADDRAADGVQGSKWADGVIGQGRLVARETNGIIPLSMATNYEIIHRGLKTSGLIFLDGVWRADGGYLSDAGV